MSYSAVQAMQSLRVEQAFLPSRARVGVHGERRKMSRKLARLIPPFVLFSTLLMQLSIRLAIIEHGYELETLREQALSVDTELRQQRLELAMTTRPKLIAERAEKRLGMNLVPAVRVRTLGAE